jgi:predicted NBD/HSP70 family sugar kinase
MKIGVVRDQQVLAQTVIPANSKIGLAPGLPQLKASWLRLLAKLKLSVGDCDGIAMAFPSLVDPKSGRVLAEYGKFADAMGLDLRAWAKDELGLPLAIENDARMALVGEWLAGAGQGCENLVMITLFSSSGLAKEPVQDYAAVFRLAAQGDVCAQNIRDHSLRVWSSLAVNLIHAYDSELVILGGGIMASAEVIGPFVQNYVDQHAHTPWGKVRVVASRLGDKAVFAAAEWLLEEQSAWLPAEQLAK